MSITMIWKSSNGKRLRHIWNSRNIIFKKFHFNLYRQKDIIFNIQRELIAIHENLSLQNNTRGVLHYTHKLHSYIFDIFLYLQNLF